MPEYVKFQGKYFLTGKIRPLYFAGFKNRESMMSTFDTKGMLKERDMFHLR